MSDDYWVCSFGVVNCPICSRFRVNKAEAQAELARKTKSVVELVLKGLSAGRIKPKISPTGDISFIGLTDQERRGLTDMVIYRNLLKEGLSTLAAAAFERAEQLAGRKVDPRKVQHEFKASWTGGPRNTLTQGR